MAKFRGIKKAVEERGERTAEELLHEVGDLAAWAKSAEAMAFLFRKRAAEQEKESAGLPFPGCIGMLDNNPWDDVGKSTVSLVATLLQGCDMQKFAEVLRVPLVEADAIHSYLSLLAVSYMEEMAKMNLFEGLSPEAIKEILKKVLDLDKAVEESKAYTGNGVQH